MSFLWTEPLALSDTAGHWFRTKDDDVWTQWSLGSNLGTRSATEAANFSLSAERPHTIGLLVHNTHQFPIHNVTLAAQARGAIVDANLSETYAGDPAQKYYAFWPTLAENATGFNDAVLDVGSPGPFILRFLVFFEKPSGDQAFSVTAVHGMAEGPQVRTIPTIETSLTVAIIGFAIFSIRSRR